MPAVMHRLDLKLAKNFAESSGLVKQSPSPLLMVQLQHQDLNRPQLRPAFVTKANNDPTAIEVEVEASYFRAYDCCGISELGPWSVIAQPSQLPNHPKQNYRFRLQTMRQIH